MESLGLTCNACSQAFTNTLGAPIAFEGFGRRDWSRLVKAAGLPHTHFHCLRHSYASLLINRGADWKTVATRLGHKNAAMTLNIYTHVVNGEADTTADMLADLG